MGRVSALPFNMILLTLNIRNDNVCLTLNEKQTLVNPYFLFELWQTPEEKQYFIQSDTSGYPLSYNKFSLLALPSGTPDASDGEFLAGANTDLWNYKVYESETDSLDPEDATSVLETGLLRVDIAREQTTEIEQTSTVINLG